MSEKALRSTTEAAAPAPFLKRGQSFKDLYDLVRQDQKVSEAFIKKIREALFAWAIQTMGLKRDRYMKEALETFFVLCALELAQTGNVAGFIEKVPVQFPLHLSKKRIGFVRLLPLYVQIAVEYNEVRLVIESEKSKSKGLGAAHFRHSVAQALKEQMKIVAPDRFLKTLSSYESPLAITPSEIAFDYVGAKHGTSRANVKKIVRLATRPDLALPALKRDLQKTFLATDAVLKSLLEKHT